MPAVNTDLTVEQGSDFARAWGSDESTGVLVDGQVIDDGWTARGQIRADVADTTVLYDLAPEVDEQGFVKIAVPASTSSTWSWTDGVYDIEIVGPGGSPTLRVAKGKVTVDPEVTRG